MAANSNSSKADDHEHYHHRHDQFRIFDLLCLLTFFILVFKPKFLLVVASILDDYGDEITPTCNADLTSILPPPYSDLSSLTCSLIWQQKFAFSFFQDINNVTTIVLSGKHENRWVGIGFSKDGKMINSSAIVGWIYENGTSGIKQYSLQGKEVNQVIPDKGNLQFTNAKPVILLNNGNIYIAFQIRSPISLAFQPILMAIGQGNPIKGHLLPKHIDKTSTVIEFSVGHLSGLTATVKDLRRYHGLSAIIGWGVLTPLGGIIARYFRHVEPLWYYFHSSIQFAGFFSAGISLAIGRNLYARTNSVLGLHKFFGYCAFTLCALQVCQFVGQPSIDSKLRKYWNLGHYWVGRVATMMGVMNIFIGFCGIKDDHNLKLVFLILFILLVAGYIVLELRLRTQLSDFDFDSDSDSKSQPPPVFQVVDKSYPSKVVSIRA